MRDLKAGNREIRSDCFASSKSSNWKAGAQVQPTREKWCSESLGGSLTVSMLSETCTSKAGNAPNQTFGWTVCCTCWLTSRTSGPRHVSLPVPPSSSNSNTWKNKCQWTQGFGENYNANAINNDNNFTMDVKKITSPLTPRNRKKRTCKRSPKWNNERGKHGK